MSVVPPEFGLQPALFAHNGGRRQSTSAPQLRDAFPAAVVRTCTVRPLSAFPVCGYCFSSSLLLSTHAIIFFSVCQGKFLPQHGTPPAKKKLDTADLESLRKGSSLDAFLLPQSVLQFSVSPCFLFYFFAPILQNRFPYHQFGLCFDDSFTRNSIM